MTYFAISSSMTKLFMIICNVLYIVCMGSVLLYIFSTQQFLAYKTYIELIYLLEKYITTVCSICPRWHKYECD